MSWHWQLGEHTTAGRQAKLEAILECGLGIVEHEDVAVVAEGWTQVLTNLAQDKNDRDAPRA